jgi:3',5'-cyclic AMP phosphodiesterase CpdA
MKKLIITICILASNSLFADITDIEIPNNALHFFVIGDWGRNGEYGQKEIAQIMADAAKQVEPEFIISTGDNFYPSGVRSVMDPHWKASFEDIYSNHSLQGDWYVILGNHDYKGNPDAQIEYSTISRRWNMPARYFEKKFKINRSQSAQFIFMDTNPFVDAYHKENETYQVKGMDTAGQRRWMDSILNVTSKQDWKFVIGHHSIYSLGKRKPGMKDLMNKFDATFKSHGVHAYICGHEHDLQIIHPENQSTIHFISGAGSEIRNAGVAEGKDFYHGKQGFMMFSIMENKTLVQVIDISGKVISKYTLTK